MSHAGRGELDSACVILNELPRIFRNEATDRLLASTQRKADSFASRRAHVLMPHFPQRMQVSAEFMKKYSHAFGGAPPTLRIIIIVRRANHPQLCAWRQTAFINIFRSARV